MVPPNKTGEKSVIVQRTEEILNDQNLSLGEKLATIVANSRQ